jgi:TIR domain
MLPDVFISYATEDEAAALAVFELLEAQSLSCWMAGRSITPGSEWAREVAGV